MRDACDLCSHLAAEPELLGPPGGPVAEGAALQPRRLLGLPARGRRRLDEFVAWAQPPGDRDQEPGRRRHVCQRGSETLGARRDHAADPDRVERIQERGLQDRVLQPRGGQAGGLHRLEPEVRDEILLPVRGQRAGLFLDEEPLLAVQEHDHPAGGGLGHAIDPSPRPYIGTVTVPSWSVRRTVGG